MRETKAAPSVTAPGAECVNRANLYESQVRTTILPQTSNQGKRILMCLQTGRENALWRRELLTLTGLSDRGFRHEVEALRCAGVPILSGDTGYWIADLSTPDGLREAARFLRQECSRARAIAKRLDPLRRSVAAAQSQGTEQTLMEGWM